jgi:N-acetylmuramoyl-L-alanine amidase
MMRRSRSPSGNAPRGVLAFIGLFFMFGSLVWLQFFPASSELSVTSEPARPQEAVALVVIDPGHGGVDSGALSAGVLEKDLTLDVAQRLRRIIHLHGFETLLTRDGDEYKSLANRADFANRQRDCIFISIHFDEGKLAASTGVETYYAERQFERAVPFSSWLPFLRQAGEQSPNLFSQSLAGFIQESLVLRTQAFNRGTRTEQFYVIANVRHPAVLVEGGFLTNQDDVAKLASGEYRERMATAICEGILHYRDALRGRQSTLAVAAPEG